MLAALVLTAAIQIEVDLSGLLAAHWRREPGKVTCGIRTVGYRWRGAKGETVRYMGRTYDIRNDDGTLELIAGRHVPKGAEEQHDQFGFRDVRRAP